VANPTTSKAEILVVDDETSARTGLVELLRDEGFSVRGAADAFKAIGQIADWTPDLVITDVHMPGMDGIALMQKLRDHLSNVGVVVMTAYSTVEKAVEAMRLGADDYLTKPLRLDELLVVVERILAHRKTLRELDRLRDVLRTDDDDAGWVGRSRVSREIVQLLKQVANSHASVLLVGESGTGKRTAARALHHWSSRSNGPFEVLHCGALDEAALNRELFGTVGHEGRVARADGGTLFLDEVASLSLATQVQLLRLLQDGEYESAGSDSPRKADVRVIAATQRDLHEEVRAGRFREDLFYRLDVITVRLPTLQERREDIPLLAMHFLRRHAVRHHKDLLGFSDRALQAMQAFDWPGNVRQLENCVEQAVVLCNELEIEPRHLPRDVLEKQRDPLEMPTIPGASMAEIEQYTILRTLEACGGSTSRAAKVLGISARTIQYRMNAYRDRMPSGLPLAMPVRGPQGITGSSAR
jgi:DNA-binding NtrC family response regulator